MTDFYRQMDKAQAALDRRSPDDDDYQPPRLHNWRRCNCEHCTDRADAEYHRMKDEGEIE